MKVNDDTSAPKTNVVIITNAMIIKKIGTYVFAWLDCSEYDV